MSAPVAPEKPVAVVVPGTPAPVAPPEQATQRDTPNTNALADAFKQMGQQMVEEGSRPPLTDPLAAGVPGTDAPPPAPVTPPTPTQQPRDPETGQYVAREDAPPVALETPVVAPAAPEVTTDAPPADEPDPALIVELPLNRFPGQEPLRLAVDSLEIADALRQNMNGALRREEYDAAMAEVETRAQRLEDQEVALATDPIRALADTLNTDQIDQVLLVLLSDEAIYARLGAKLEQLQDDLGRRELRADAREAYTQQRDQQQGVIAHNRMITRNQRDVTRAVEAIIPEGLSAAQAQLWRTDALRELSVVCKRHNLVTLDPMKVPTALQSRLLATGVDPADAAERIARSLYGRKAAAAPNGAPRAAPSASSAAPAAGSPMTGNRPVATLKAAQERRVVAASLAGAGTGTPSAGGMPTLPEGAGLDEALALVRRMTATAAR